MLKTSCLYFFIFFLALNSIVAQPPAQIDEFKTILNVKENRSREEQLIRYIKNYFTEAPASDLSDSKTKMADLVYKSNIQSKDAIMQYTESIYQGRLLNASASENAMIKAIQAAGRSKDDFLSCTFLNYLAYKQTEEGNVIGAFRAMGWLKRMQ